jgi:hypothetical protein
MNNFFKKIRQWFELFDQYNREQYIELQERELAELENIFNVLVAGYLIGLPAPPSHVALELLPYILPLLDTMTSKVEKSFDPFGELFSIFDID